ncbi:hypothetical protein JAAARDRAFT_30302 [Jaapia argillacea MUCL 33604]|uniref:thioredoxin-dependent peroxiredoxin n=1 Tax=Jaapia argillacea MUCL 33604 TaxID=933084 RepID=A0A067Q5R8_9AGAM|nr:hypothetical protein JAAARDRAFT_30302 [Jaapia argillacea MUCL 33604]
MTKSLVDKLAPQLSLPDANGETYTFTPGAKGVPAAIFFYPKSGSYGCTKEACQFRDAVAEKDVFKTDKLELIGISADSVAEQKKFVEQHKLTYPVLSDEKGEARKAFHVGKGLFGFVDARITVVVDKKGIVRDVLDTTVNYGAHSKFVTKWLEKLQTEDQTGVPSSPPPPTETTTAPEPQVVAGSHTSAI